MTPKITVVIPLYNKEQYIAQAIQSVLDQTYRNFELIVVDDGSTDKSQSIVSGITDSRIRLLTQPNSGVSVARNSGIKNAKGEIIAFLDADDQWEPTFLEKINELAEKYPEAGIYGTAYTVYSNDTFLRKNTWHPEQGDRILESYYHDVAEYGSPLFHSSSFASPRKVLQFVNGYQEDYRSGQDHDLYGRIALYYPIAYSPSICSRYNAGIAGNHDRISYAREVPLERYFLSLPEEVQSKYLERSDFKYYMNFYYLKIGGINVYGGFRNEGRSQLIKVSDKSMQIKKYMFILLSYIPISMSVIPPSIARTIGKLLKLAT